MASTPTSNFSLNKPAKGDKNWGSNINANWDTIDSQMFSNQSNSIINSSNIIINTSSITATSSNVFNRGVPFPATQLPSADANTLDDYEEGTFTPDLQFGGAKVGITYSRQVGWYRKVGSVVTFGLNFILTSTGTSIGDADVFDLPFAANAATNQHTVFPVRCAQVSFTGVPVGLLLAGNSFVSIKENSSGGTNIGLTEANFKDNSDIYVSGSYYTT